MEILNFEQIVADFNERLITQLRGHGAQVDYLEMWVPDGDPVLSLLNMVEAAEAYGRKDIAIRFTTETLPQVQCERLAELLKKVGKAEFTAEGDARLLVVTF